MMHWSRISHALNVDVEHTSTKLVAIDNDCLSYLSWLGFSENIVTDEVVCEYLVTDGFSRDMVTYGAVSK